MTEDRWLEIKDLVKNQYDIIEQSHRPLTIKIGVSEEKEIGDIEVIIFKNPQGKIKLEYSKKPVVLEKKEHYSHRAGTSAKTEYILSPDEFVSKLTAYKWDREEEDWIKFETENFNE